MSDSMVDPRLLLLLRIRRLQLYADNVQLCNDRSVATWGRRIYLPGHIAASPPQPHGTGLPRIKYREESVLISSSVWHRYIFLAAMAILLLVSVSVFVTTAQADGPLPRVDTAERDDVVAEDDEGGASGAVDEDSGARLPDVDTAQRDDVVVEDDEGGASGAVDEDSGARLPDVDTAQRDDVVPEDDGGGASGAVDEGSEGRLPDVDTAQRDDVVEEEGGATGRAANAPAPTGLRVTSDTDDSVSLSWNTVTDAGAYKVEYRRSGSISWLHAGYVYSSTSDTVDGLDCNTSYYFRVRARATAAPTPIHMATLHPAFRR